ncbi:MAG: Asp/Glu racemase [Blastopirellula sp.]|nr:MAG: Asp/Glu racemase [Blastopirellula sp.]
MINPNSNQAVTDGLVGALEVFKPTGAFIECVTLQSGPYGIETQADIESVTLPLAEIVRSRTDVDCFVIACYSDPGLHVCRDATDKPVLGIQESGVLTALARGDRFGVIALHPASIRRHLRYLRQMCVTGRLANERSVNLSVAQSASADGTFNSLVEVGMQLRDTDGADTVILGCAGMAKHRANLEQKLGIPVIDPVQAAVGLGISLSSLNM